jgi:serine/threonine-protein kinase RsbW
LGIWFGNFLAKNPLNDLKTKIFEARLSSLHPLLDWVENEAAPYVKKIKGLILACEEAVVNIINHGYRGKGGPIEVSISIGDRDVSISIADKASAFNPLLSSGAVDSSLDLEERKEGGLGIPIMKKYADEILYKREGEYNILTLKKKRY